MFLYNFERVHYHALLMLTWSTTKLERNQFLGLCFRRSLFLELSLARPVAESSQSGHQDIGVTSS